MSKTVITLGEDRWEFDEDDLDLNDAFMLKAGTGLALRPFFQGLADMDPECLRGLVWFLRRKAGEQVAVDAITFKIGDLKMEQVADPTEGDAIPSERSATD